MKTLVMTVIFAVTGMVNAFGGNVEKKFVYNEVMNGEQVESKFIYKLKEGDCLNFHLKYNFKYDAENRIIQKEVLKWNEIEKVFERYYCLNYDYNEAGTDVEYALWDNETDAYSDVRERVVYLYSGNGVSCLSYKWNKQENDWNLMAEHTVANDDILLLAGN